MNLGGRNAGWLSFATAVKEFQYKCNFVLSVKEIVFFLYICNCRTALWFGSCRIKHKHFHF
jgi:hypothetical protein